LRSKVAPRPPATLRSDNDDRRADPVATARALVDECPARLSAVLPLQRDEDEFLNRLDDQGRIVPDLLTGDKAMKATIREHPALRWKALDASRGMSVD
jgi:hypothetical protein